MPVKRSKPVHVGLAVALGVVCAVTAVIVELSGGVLETVTLDDQPRDSELALRFPTTLAFDSELRFSRRDPTSGAIPSLEATPRTAMFHLEFVRDGQVQGSLACDPQDLSGAEIAIDEAGTGRSDYRIRGSMRGCSIRLGPGRYTLRAHAQRLDAAQAAGLAGSQIEPRFKRHVF